MIDIEPSLEQVRGMHSVCMASIGYWGCEFLDADYWLAWWGSDIQHYDPIIINNTIIIGITNYSYHALTAEVHFCCGNDAGTLSNFRETQRALDSIMRNGDINVLYAHYPATYARTRKLTKALGFKEIAIANGICYTSLTI